MLEKFQREGLSARLRIFSPIPQVLQATVALGSRSLRCWGDAAWELGEIG